MAPKTLPTPLRLGQLDDGGSDHFEYLLGATARILRIGPPAQFFLGSRSSGRMSTRRTRPGAMLPTTMGSLTDPKMYAVPNWSGNDQRQISVPQQSNHREHQADDGGNAADKINIFEHLTSFLALGVARFHTLDD